MKRSVWPPLKHLVTPILLSLALALLVGGCSLLGEGSSSVSGSTTLVSRAPQSSHPATTGIARPPGTTASSSTSARPPKATTTTVDLASGDPRAVARKLGPSVVGVTAIISRSRTETLEALGTGVIYSATGLIITNNHVITDEGTYSISAHYRDPLERQDSSRHDRRAGSHDRPGRASGASPRASPRRFSNRPLRSCCR